MQPRTAESNELTLHSTEQIDAWDGVVCAGCAMSSVVCQRWRKARYTAAHRQLQQQGVHAAQRSPDRRHAPVLATPSAHVATDPEWSVATCSIAHFRSSPSMTALLCRHAQYMARYHKWATSTLFEATAALDDGVSVRGVPGSRRNPLMPRSRPRRCTARTLVCFSAAFTAHGCM